MGFWGFGVLRKRLKDYKGKPPVSVSSEGILPPSSTGTIAVVVKAKHGRSSQDQKMDGEESS